MAVDPKLGILALQRFGLGVRSGDPSQAANDPRAALEAEVTSRRVPMPIGSDLRSTKVALGELDEFRTARQIARDKEDKPTPQAGAVSAPQGAQQRQQGGAQAMAGGTMASGDMAGGGMAAGSGTMAAPGNRAPEMRNPAQDIFRSEVNARFALAMNEPIGFSERLAWFWSNHFCVSVAKGAPIRAIAGAYEREAIRPHIFGRFADMLLAVETHPAMLIYLDNRQSIGPNSRAGNRRGRGLNENLAREILELHTLGVGGGYTQTDVTSLAKIITGWTVVGPNDEDHEIGEFFFNRNRHEPGDQTVLGKVYRDGGVEQGRSALADIARHPSTAKHIATKLARHFVSDEPPAALVAALTKVFRDTDGDLAAVSLALLRSPHAWEAEARKIRSPQEFLVAAFRAIGNGVPAAPAIMGPLGAMGQQLWNPTGPNGFPDTLAHWAAAEGIKTRLDVAAQIVRRTNSGLSPNDMANIVLGPLASRETKQAIARAESRPQALALMLMSPEFQRR
jgi:uncharacterized protein (DUF1800 family)